MWTNMDRERAEECEWISLYCLLLEKFIFGIRDTDATHYT